MSARRTARGRNRTNVAVTPRNDDGDDSGPEYEPKYKRVKAGSRGAPARGTPTRGGPSRGTPSRGTPSRGTPSRGTPSRGTARGGPTRGGPARGGPTRGGPARGAAARSAPARPVKEDVDLVTLDDDDDEEEEVQIYNDDVMEDTEGATNGNGVENGHDDDDVVAESAAEEAIVFVCEAQKKGTVAETILLDSDDEDTKPNLGYVSGTAQAVPEKASKRAPVTAMVEEIVPEKYRTLFFRVTSSSVDDDALWTLYSQYGDIERLTVRDCKEPIKVKNRDGPAVEKSPWAPKSTSSSQGSSTTTILMAAPGANRSSAAGKDSGGYTTYRREGRVVFRRFHGVDSCMRSRPLVVGDASGTDTAVDIRRIEEAATETQDPCSVYLSGIFHLSAEELEKYFKSFGTVTACDVKSDRGFGFLTFEDGDSADKTLLQKFHQIDGLLIEVMRGFKKGGQRRPRPPPNPNRPPRFDMGPRSRNFAESGFAVTPFPRHVEVKPKSEDGVDATSSVTGDGRSTPMVKSEVKPEI